MTQASCWKAVFAVIALASMPLSLWATPLMTEDLEGLRRLFGFDRIVPVLVENVLKTDPLLAKRDPQQLSCIRSTLAGAYLKQVDASLRSSISDRETAMEWQSFDATSGGRKILEAQREITSSIADGHDPAAMEDLVKTMNQEEIASVKAFISSTRAGQSGFPKLLKMSEADATGIDTQLRKKCGVI